MTATANTNGRTVRKSLADQIDRLEQMLEGLSNAINETVQDAVKDAVQVAITEVLLSPELQKRLRETQNNVPVQPKHQGWFGWLGGAAKGIWSKVSWACAKVAEGVQKCWSWLCQKTTHPAGKVKKGMSLGWTWCLRKLKNSWLWIADHAMCLLAGCRNVCKGMSGLGQFLWQVRKSLVLALGVGCVVGLACYLAGPVISSTVSGLAGFAGSLFGSGLHAFRRMLAGVSLENS